MKLENDRKRTVILVAVDRTPASDPALDAALTLARANPAAELHLLHVVPPMPEAAVPAIPPTALIDNGRKFIDGVAHAGVGRFEGRVIAHLAVGEPGHRLACPLAPLCASLFASDILLRCSGDRRTPRHFRFHVYPQ